LDNRTKVRQQRLQSFGRIVSNRYGLKVKLSHGYNQIGCADSQSRIWINSEINKNEVKNLIFQKAVLFHEIGHVLFTSSSKWIKSKVDGQLRNIVEDGRVELAMSRMLPKARLYFLYINRELLKPQIPKDTSEYEMLTLEMLLREAKKRTGIPPLPQDAKQKLVSQIGANNYNDLVKKINLAVSCKTEDEAIEQTRKIEEKIREIFGVDDDENLQELQDEDKSNENCGSTARQMPDDNNDPLEDDIVEIQENDDIEEIEETLEQINEQIENDAVEELKNEQISIKNQKPEDFETYEITKNLSSSNYQRTVNLRAVDGQANRTSHVFKRIAQIGGDGWVKNQTRGSRINTKSLYQLGVKNGSTPKIFKRKLPDQEENDLSVVILLDESGSMGFRSIVATQSTYMISRALELGGYESEVVGFGVISTDRKQLYAIKSFNQSTTDSKHKFVAVSTGSTPLSSALDGAMKSLSYRKSKRKMIIVITDGRPDEPDVVKKQIKELAKQGIATIGILININDDLELFKHKFTVQSTQEIPSKMIESINNVLKEIKGGC